MFERVTMRARDLEAGRRFYELAAAPADLELTEDLRPTEHLHIAFGVPSRADVDAWWRRLVEAGYESDGEPGPRPEYSDSYYGAFVLDPDGNSVEAVHHATSGAEGVDHLWLRTRDVDAWRSLPQRTDAVRLVYDTPGRIRFALADAPGSFSFVAGDVPTTGVRLTLRASDGLFEVEV